MRESAERHQIALAIANRSSAHAVTRESPQLGLADDRIRAPAGTRRTTAPATTRWGSLAHSRCRVASIWRSGRIAVHTHAAVGAREDRGVRPSSRGGRHGVCRTVLRRTLPVGALFCVLRGPTRFWVSADFQDRSDDIAYYRAYERYGFGEFDELFDDVAKRIGERLVEELAAGDVFGRFPATSTYQAFGLAENVWLVSRSRRLRLRLHAQAVAAISSLFFAQRQEGWWPAPVTGEGGSHPPSVQATAMAVIAGLRVSTDREHRQQVEQAVTWLIGSQQADGSWAGIAGQAAVMATALALEAITISRRAGSAHVSDRGGRVAARAAAAAWHMARRSPHDSRDHHGCIGGPPCR